MKWRKLVPRKQLDSRSNIAALLSTSHSPICVASRRGVCESIADSPVLNSILTILGGRWEKPDERYHTLHFPINSNHCKEPITPTRGDVLFLIAKGIKSLEGQKESLDGGSESKSDPDMKGPSILFLQEQGINHQRFKESGSDWFDRTKSDLVDKTPETETILLTLSLLSTITSSSVSIYCFFAGE